MLSNALPLEAAGAFAIVLEAVPAKRAKTITNALRSPLSGSARAVLAFGNESRGLSKATLDLAAIRFHIPLAAGVDSLNLATAVAIAAHHVRGLPVQP